jgi:hypothetical protein
MRQLEITPLDAVFSALADPTRRYEQGVKGPFIQCVPADYEIAVYEPNRLIGFRAIAGPVRPEGSYELTPTERGTDSRSGSAARHRASRR